MIVYAPLYMDLLYQNNFVGRAGVGAVFILGSGIARFPHFSQTILQVSISHVGVFRMLGKSCLFMLQLI